MGFMNKIKGAFKTPGQPEKSETPPPKKSEEKVYRYITCGAEISKDEYEENEGQCDNCVAEDTVYAAPDEFGF